MDNITFPTSRDVYIEINGEKLAVVENYKAVSNREERLVQSFGEDNPVAILPYKTKYKLELSKIYVYQGLAGDSVDFHNLAGFTLVIVKPNKTITYSGCEWLSINESTQIGEKIIENAIILAKDRAETIT